VAPQERGGDQCGGDGGGGDHRDHPLTVAHVARAPVRPCGRPDGAWAGCPVSPRSPGSPSAATGFGGGLPPAGREPFSGRSAFLASSPTGELVGDGRRTSAGRARSAAAPAGLPDGGSAGRTPDRVQSACGRPPTAWHRGPWSPAAHPPRVPPRW
jgi:hypothetical protein